MSSASAACRQVGVTLIACGLLGAAACRAPERIPEAEALRIDFVLDEEAFRAPPPSAPVPFDIVTADMDLDGDADLLVNWHNLAHLELFENDSGGFTLRNPADDDDSALFENPGIPDLYGVSDQMVALIAAEGRRGVYVWHDLDRRGDWNIYVVPGDDLVSVALRANGKLTPKLPLRFIASAGDFDAELAIDRERHFRVGVEFVATQLVVAATAPVFVGREMQASGDRVVLWKDDPHGVAWLDVSGSPEPDVFITRGGLMGNLLPPHGAKTDRFFEYRAAETLFADLRALVPPNYGRGRRVEWVDVDADMLPELYVGNTATANNLLSSATGTFVDIAPSFGLDVLAGDTFAWFDVDGDARDDLVFVDESGFQVAYNGAGGEFQLRPGATVGLEFPPGSVPVNDDLFATLSLNVLDFDNDGRLDVWLAGHGQDRRHALYRGTEDGFVAVTGSTGLDRAPGVNSMVLLDIDNDGYIDALTMGLTPARLLNDGGREFLVEELDPEWNLRAFARGTPVDMDLDGLLDVAIVDSRRLLLRNVTTGGGEALRVDVKGSGADPVGTLVSAVYASGMVQAQRYGSARNTQYSQGTAPLHFGIPHQDTIELLRVRWPDGRSEERPVLPGDRQIVLRH